MKRTADMVDYDKIHLEKREKLQHLLLREHEEFVQEQAERDAIRECGYCENKNRKEQYEEDLDKEKIRECLKALEREKIAKGMKSTKADEIFLREMQREQMIEKKRIQQSQEDVDMMWHQVLLEDVRIKEEQERLRIEKDKQEIIERRLAYDEQISSANRKRREVIQSEREIENRRLEKMKYRMEQDYYDAITRKKNQQMTNKMNYLEGFNMKMSRMKNDKEMEKQVDDRIINTALEELRREREQKIARMECLKMEKKLFVDHRSRERKIAENLEKETERIAFMLKQEKERDADDVTREIEVERRNNRYKASQEYKNYLEDLNIERERQRKERMETMARVKETAHKELTKKLEHSKEELNNQIKYRKSLTKQIQENKIIMKMENKEIYEKQLPFTKNIVTFKDAMRDIANQNPVHPFRKLMQAQPENPKSLPLIRKLN
ncbi:hypothetical protein KGM_200048 [Danaus plexippus plexippus]|uniref:Trichohyalin-plectin-homology domain-containing protein n=1 Tax=Danaus plexippus plexippus TaxID=278856 RepID=A0A212EWA0_DANPL|nr:hypothetical protein KGM_200048 [Danaus plexippus plexippus]